MATKPTWNGSAYAGPDLEDCIRLWTTLTTEYITDLEVTVQLPVERNRSFRPRLVLQSPGLDADTGQVKWRTWSTKDLQQSYEAITYRQLYDLLIVGHREIESFLGGQNPLPLP